MAHKMLKNYRLRFMAYGVVNVAVDDKTDDSAVRKTRAITHRLGGHLTDKCEENPQEKVF